MNAVTPLIAASESLETQANLSLARRLLAEAGCKIFDAHPAYRRTELDLIVVHPNRPACPAWIYPSRAGRLVIRPWANAAQARDLKRRLPAEHRSKLRLMISRPMPLTPAWHDWLSPASKREARLLGLPV